MLETQEMTVVNPSPKKRGPKPGVRRRRAPERVVAYPESVQARLDTRTFEALNATAARMGYSRGWLVAELIEGGLKRLGALAEPTDRAA